MNGLREHLRDASLPAAAGEPGLQPPDEAAVLELAREHLLLPGVPSPLAADWTYARWKPGVSLASGHVLRWADGASRLLLLKLYAGDKARHLELRPPPDDAGRDDADDRLLPSAVLAGRGLQLAVYPHDRELPGLPRLLELHRTRRLLAGAGLFEGRVVRAHRSRAVLLRYRPESRAVLRLDLGLRATDGARSEAHLAARVLPPATAAGVAAARGAAPHLRAAPRLLAVEARTGLLLEEWLDVDTPRPDDFSRAEAAGGELARLHAPASGAPRVDDLSAHAPLFAWHPELAALASGLRAPACDGPPRWTHGDFHPDQLAVERAGGALRLLDLDRLGPGLAVDDLASWVADVLVAAPGTAPDAAAGPLLDGYVATGGTRPGARELHAALAAALVARAAAALRRLEDGAVGRAARLLEAARAVAPRGSVFP